MTDRTGLTRRTLLAAGVAASTGLSALPAAAARYFGPYRRVRSIGFVNLHTDEKLDTVYWADGRFVAEALEQIAIVLRDHRNDQTHPIDGRLLVLLDSLRQQLDTGEPLHVISGYRSPASNAKLARESGQVARNSLHMQGLAIDIRVPGRDLTRVREAAISLKGGGVGYYPRSGFVHLDVGRVRYW
jgi:uncharacterized protein YcbK (DUF882 family)